ncbi:MAG: hypothetical protein GF346_08345 [Candidatus Eisenbacteria bacterium]|nr:hypothetical protein [Candidatus Latescibacterota bacterium]MBD3302443.1 hypothetical protein [Candidatus Eisenbacteria bacterium]
MRIQARTLFRSLGIAFIGVAVLWIVFGLVEGNLSFAFAVSGFNVVIGMLLLFLSRRVPHG